MSESSHLILNLNKMMEAYTEVEEEIVQTGQTESRRSEERGEVNKETNQSVEESRKKKRGAEEAEIEQRNESVRILILDKAFALMEKSLKDRGFMVENGFKRLISHFSEMMEKRE